MLEAVPFVDEGGEGQAPLSVGDLYANGISNARMERSVEDGLADARAKIYEGGVRP